MIYNQALIPSVAAYRRGHSFLYSSYPRIYANINPYITMRGDRKRAKTTFSNKNQPSRSGLQHSETIQCEIPTRIIRVEQDLHDFVTENTTDGDINDIRQLPRNTAGEPVNISGLRPRPSPSKLEKLCDSQRSESDTYVILHRGKLEEFWNKAFRGHIGVAATCDGQLIFDDDACTQWGLGWRMAVKCDTCTFKSSQEKIYTETDAGKAGQKSATVTRGFQIGISKQGLGNAGLREILLAANINPPSIATMQVGANKVNKVITEANKHDMGNILEDIKQKSQALGKPSDHPIPAEADATYNNRLFSGSGSTPFQAGTQVTFLVAEGLTPSKKIVATRTYSKLCTCVINDSKPDHTEECTANLDYDRSIGHEGSYLRDAISDVNEHGVQIGDLTLDGDSSSRAAAQSITQPGGASINPQYCTKHLTRLMQKNIRKTQFSKCMFKGRNKSIKDKAHTRFSHDISHRVSAEYNALHRSTKGSFEDMSKKLPGITDAIIDCYRGSCIRCSEHSYLCNEDSPWVRPFIDTDPQYKGRREFVSPSAEDLTKLRALIGMRLGPAALTKTITNTNQNKCEAANRGVKKAVPSHLTFRRNYEGRVHSAVHSMNNGPGTSTALLCREMGCPVSGKSTVMRNLIKLDATKIYNSKRKRSTGYKLSRRTARMERYKAYDEKQNEDNGYQSGRAALHDVLPALFIPPRHLPGHLNDHNYMTRSVRVTRPAAATMLAGQ